jgi:DNA-binding CsgD family transcriptional regulator
VTAIAATRGADLVLLDCRRILPYDRLSARERQVAGLYAAGRTQRQIAAQLRISASTVDNHLSAIYRKLGISTKAQLFRIASEARLLR